jgi:molybdopterin/thiamine biosynthesis adenylyltransferase/proteasome lid subunit RPN8/RPN11
MTATIVMTSSIADELRHAAMGQVETAGVLLATTLEAADGGLRLLVREIHWVEEAAYARREADGLSIRSTGYVHALARAEETQSAAIWMHTHPGRDSNPVPSEWDEIVDRELADLFRLRTGSEYYGALVVSPGSTGIIFCGHVQARSGSRLPLTNAWIVGDRLTLIASYDSEPLELATQFDRNVRALGRAIQETLRRLHIGIVGCGGTGSAVAEQLVRLGVRDLILIDPDRLSDSNVTRVYGSTVSDIGKPKVEVLKGHLSRISDDVRVEAIQSSITLESAAKRLVGCHVLFGCTDDNAGRLVLSRAATYLLVPVIDCGVLITSDDAGCLTGIHGRVTVLTPGQACLVCRGRIDLAQAAAETMSQGERIRRANEGYAPALGATEPAVITFTTAVAAAAVSELLERMIGYGPDQRPSEILLRYHEREISTNSMLPKAKHYCDPAVGKVGAGDTDPFLGQTWPG